MRIEKALENLMFSSRWLLAPIYIGLIGAIILLLVKFGQEFFHIAPHLFDSTEGEVVLAVLTLVDMSLVANLLIIIIFSGYENFVSKIDVAGHVDRPEWMGKVNYSGLKLKLIASVVAISGIELLKSFVNIQQDIKEIGEHATNIQLAWKIGIHTALVVTGLLFALTDRIAEPVEHPHSSETDTNSH